jgi:lysophospholipase
MVDPAPLLNVPRQSMPPGGVGFWLRAVDGVKLRAALWRQPDTGRGTVFLLNGRTEFIEKYADAAVDLMARGFHVLALDWRGQGLSDRLIADPARGHVARFEDYELDLEALTTAALVENLPRPWLVVAHSMGGHNVLRQAAFGRSRFDGLALSAPMCRINMPGPQALLRAIVKLGASFAAQSYAPGQGPPGPKDDVFAGNTLTSDEDRFNVMVAAFRMMPKLRLGGVTFNWLNEALKSMEAVQAPGRLESITIPVMLGMATHDRIVDPSIYPAMVQRLARGTLVEIAGAEHEILREKDQHRQAFWAGFDQSIGKLATS